MDLFRAKWGLWGLLLSLGCIGGTARAEWSLNIGYHNPHGSRLGLNFLYWGSQWNFEAGIGWLDGSVQEKDSTQTSEDQGLSAELYGDLDFKYRLTNGVFAPFLQLGMGTGTGLSVGEKSGAGFSLSSPFVGLGLILGKAGFYGYGAYDYFPESEAKEIQAGLGFSL